MNKKYLISIHMILIGFMIGVINAFAARRIITFEMGESGQTVSFLMSKEEIAFADAVREHAKTSDATATSKPIKTLVDRVEMPESGQYIEFPVTNKADYGAISKAEKNVLHTSLDSDKNKQILEMVDNIFIIFSNGESRWGSYPVQ
jgi:hypothetical protein